LRLRQGRLPPAYWVSRLYLCSLLISNTKARKPVVTVGASEKWKTGLGPCGSIASTSTLCVKNHSPVRRTPPQPTDRSQASIPSRTVSTNTPQSEGRKNGLKSGKTGGTTVYAPNCSVSLLSNLFKSLSFLRTPSILSTECKTVVWCLPPNWRPISGREASVRCLARYIAICRG